MNTQATKVIALPDNPAVRQLSEMACPEGSRITSCPCNRDVKHWPNGLVVLGILTNEQSRPARLPLVVRVALEAHGGPGQVLRTPFSHFADVVV
jgi:hypothetical protein